ncbi:helix-turn-helix transcriptional regulator [Curtobacterium sp. MCLR17_036]|uniref:helix-turn-helix domain-containing protein n=1 Tax=Curtobacterium sp. MCLR17_036 TaxID=2175620 RepID=UPI000DA9D0C9|nr:helix-turn-helix domain-containing protein [Curtobacterium sp. MCLR17_036]WIE66474.1 helix-turn-helix transcriptional regulator [Curtobacterium sp. MCLR17_036]
MTVEPADPRISFETSGADLEAALHMYEDAYDGTGFDATRTDRPFAYRFRVVGDDVMSFRSTRFDARMQGEIDDGGEYVVNWTTEGGGRIDIGRDEVALRPGHPVVFPTGRPFAFDLQDVRQSLVQFDRSYLEGIAAEVHGTQPGPLVFDHTAAPDPEDLRGWNAQVQGAAATVLGTGPVSALAFAETARATAHSLLRTFPHQVLAPEVTLPQGATGRVCEAIEYMHAHSHTPMSTTDVAEYVGLSVRGLQQAFQRQVGTAPNAMLRGIRLDRVREELRRSSASETTVAAIAVRWGFAHLGRFSAAYASRFGEYPRETLQR